MHTASVYCGSMLVVQNLFLACDIFSAIFFLDDHSRILLYVLCKNLIASPSLMVISTLSGLYVLDRA
jgi:hypothetical protein